MRKELLILFLFVSYTLADALDICNDEGSHSNDWWFVPELSGFEISLGINILLFTFIAVLPQIIKLIRKRSTVGISHFYMFLISINTMSGFVNTTILNYPYMESCPYVGYGVCSAALLTWGQFVVTAAVYVIEYTLFVIFYDDKKSKKWKIVIISYIFYLLFTCVSIAMVIISVKVLDNCSTFSILYARVCGIAGVVLVCIQYIPQLITTYKTKSSGSLSVITTLIQAFGMTVMILFMAVSTGQDFSSYLKKIMSWIIQVILGIMIVYYDYIRPKCCKSKQEKEEVKNAEKSKLIETEIEMTGETEANVDMTQLNDTPQYNENELKEENNEENEKKTKSSSSSVSISSSSSNEQQNEEKNESINNDNVETYDENETDNIEL